MNGSSIIRSTGGTLDSGPTVYIVTFNVNRQPIRGLDLRALLRECEVPPDIYAIGFQELPNHLFGDDKSWIDLFLAGLHPGAMYQLVGVVRLRNEILLAVAMQTKLADYKYSTATATKHSVRPKGAAGLSLCVDKLSICFVNSHFFPHVLYVEKRNADHDYTFEKMTFHNDRSINEHDVVFFFGDLNYRLDPNEHQQHIQFDRLLPDQVSRLLEYDQLKVQMKSGRVFRQFTEGPIKFGPTYKYMNGTNDWNTERAQAWCDRILWRGSRAKQLVYQSVPGILFSDHKPVYSIFRLRNEFRTSDPGRNKVSLDRFDVTFPLIRFLETNTQTIRICNRNAIETEVWLSVRQDSVDYYEHWLDIEPNAITIAPGEYKDITLRIRVASNACVLRAKMDLRQMGPIARIPINLGTLVVEQANDLFQAVQIRGSFIGNVFGQTMVALSQKQRLPTSAIPREIESLVQHLYEHALDTPDLFANIAPNDSPEIKRICEQLEANQLDGLSPDPHALAQTLLLLLESSPDRLISHEEANNEQCFPSDFLNRMSVVNREVLLYIFDFLQAYISNKKTNKCDPGKVAVPFARALMKEHPARIERRYVGEVHERRRIYFMVKLLSMQRSTLQTDRRNQVTLDRFDVTFTPMKFFETYTQTLQITNGQTIATPVRLSLRQDSVDYYEHWLDIEPNAITIAPGESQNITLRIRLNASNACVLRAKMGPNQNANPTQLGTLVVEAANEQLQAVPIHGSFAANVFGLMMESLSQQQRLPSAIPREIERLVQHLYEHALHTPDLFADIPLNNNAHDSSEIQRVCEQLEANQLNELSSNPHAVAQTLLLLLESSPDRLISHDEAANEKCFPTDFLSRMSLVNRKVLLHIFDFLQDYISNKKFNKCDPGKVAMPFARALVKEHPARIVQSYVGQDHDNRRLYFMVRLLTMKRADLVGQPKPNMSDYGYLEHIKWTFYDH